MRKLALIAAAIIVTTSFSFAQARHARTFRGEIMDSMCATMGGHSPGGYQATHTHTIKELFKKDVTGCFAYPRKSSISPYISVTSVLNSIAFFGG